MWINETVVRQAKECLAMACGIMDKLKEGRGLTEPRHDFSRSEDVGILQAELRTLTRQRAEANRALVALHVECMSFKAEVMKLQGCTSAACSVNASLQGKPAEYPDRRSAAAHDDTLFVTREEEERP